MDQQERPVATAASPLLVQNPANQRAHSNTVDRKPKTGGGLDMSKTVEKKSLEEKMSPFKVDNDRRDGVESDNGQKPTDFHESFKEQPKPLFEPAEDATDYRAGQPSLGGRLSIAGRSAGKSGRSGRKAKGSILEAYGALSEKSQEKTPGKRR